MSKVGCSGWEDMAGDVDVKLRTPEDGELEGERDSEAEVVLPARWSLMSVTLWWEEEGLDGRGGAIAARRRGQLRKKEVRRASLGGEDGGFVRGEMRGGAAAAG